MVSMTAPSKYFCTAKITEAILNQIKACGTFIIKFRIEICLLKDDSGYHENKWHSLVQSAISIKSNYFYFHILQLYKTIFFWSQFKFLIGRTMLCQFFLKVSIYFNIDSNYLPGFTNKEPINKCEICEISSSNSKMFQSRGTLTNVSSSTFRRYFGGGAMKFEVLRKYLSVNKVLSVRLL